MLVQGAKQFCSFASTISCTRVNTVQQSHPDLIKARNPGWQGTSTLLCVTFLQQWARWQETWKPDHSLPHTLCDNGVAKLSTLHMQCKKPLDVCPTSSSRPTSVAVLPVLPVLKWILIWDHILLPGTARSWLPGLSWFKCYLGSFTSNFPTHPPPLLQNFFKLYATKTSRSITSSPCTHERC